MIKHINYQNFLTTPFVAVKEWELYNVQNDDVVLIDPTGSIEVPVAMDYVDYSGTSPILNRLCNIALEQQSGNDVIYQEGESGSGYFFPDAPKNADGTYKRLIYDQTKKSFYNLYRDSFKIFGMDHIDFPLGKTDRQISEFIRLFNIPQRYWGDRLVPRSIQLYDTSLDDNVSVRDDGYQNLLAGTNLFSKVQEIRYLGNIIIDGNITNSCEVYDDTSASLSTSASVDLAGVQVGYLYGSLDYRTEEDFAGLIARFYDGTLFNQAVDMFGGDSGSVNLIFESGSIFDQVVTITASYETSSVNIVFHSGSIYDQVLTTRQPESGSLFMNYYSASIITEAVPFATQSAYQTMSIGFLNGTKSIVAGGTGYATGSGGIVYPE